MNWEFFIAGGCVGLGLGMMIGTLIGYRLSMKDDEEIKELNDAYRDNGE